MEQSYFLKLLFYLFNEWLIQSYPVQILERDSYLLKFYIAFILL